MPTKRSSPLDFAIISDDTDISATSNSANRSCRQNSSEGCRTVGTRSIASGVTCPSMIGQVRGFEVRPMLNCNLMSVIFSRLPNTRASSVHGEAAGDADGLAGDVGGVIREKEGDQPRIVFRRAEPPHRNGALEPLGDAGAVRPFEEAAQDGGIGRAGAEGVEDHALADEL